MELHLKIKNNNKITDLLQKMIKLIKMINTNLINLHHKEGINRKIKKPITQMRIKTNIVSKKIIMGRIKVVKPKKGKNYKIQNNNKTNKNKTKIKIKSSKIINNEMNLTKINHLQIVGKMNHNNTILRKLVVRSDKEVILFQTSLLLIEMKINVILGKGQDQGNLQGKMTTGEIIIEVIRIMIVIRETHIMIEAGQDNSLHIRLIIIKIYKLLLHTEICLIMIDNNHHLTIHIRMEANHHLMTEEAHLITIGEDHHLPIIIEDHLLEHQVVTSLMISLMETKVDIIITIHKEVMIKDEVLPLPCDHLLPIMVVAINIHLHQEEMIEIMMILNINRWPKEEEILLTKDIRKYLSEVYQETLI